VSAICGIDGGLRACGVGLSRLSTGRIFKAWLVKNPLESGEGMPAWTAMGRAVAEAVRAALVEAGEPERLALLVVENQWINRGGFTPNASDILNVAHVIGAIGAVMEAEIQIEIQPTQWKAALLPGKWRSSGKDWTKDQAAEALEQRIWQLLHASERKATEGADTHLGHNVTDAIGVTMWGRNNLRRLMMEARALKSDA